MKIGELSRQTKCNVETIRYYERIGLLPRPRRQGKYRHYECDDVARLKFIRRARQLGFRVDDVRGLLLLARVDGKPARAKIRSIAARHVADIRKKIDDLQAMARVLTGAICECEATRRRGCPIIEVLSADEPD
jgi:MerR family transcriptional regulator, mercuric resistance operon regulatory protein